MTDYLLKALKEVNPCGIKSRQETNCGYASECRALGRSGEYLCIPHWAYQLANGIHSGEVVDLESERDGDLTKFVQSGVGRQVIDPKEWDPHTLRDDEVEKVITAIFERAQGLYESAQRRASEMDPLNFACSVEDVISDL